MAIVAASSGWPLSRRQPGRRPGLFPGRRGRLSWYFRRTIL